MTFLEKYELLKKSIPVAAVWIIDSSNCVYGDMLWDCENCNNCFLSSYLKDGIYTTLGLWSNKLIDCVSVEASEKCYQCIDSNKCHSSTFLINCSSCTDCHFSAFLNSCTDCFGCVALAHKKYCIFNEQYTKDAYFKKVEQLKKDNPEKILSQMLKLKQTIPHPASIQNNNEKCPYGNYIYNSRNSYWCFNSYNIENSGYTFIAANIKNCWDLYFSGSGGKPYIDERCYELVFSGHSLYNCAYLYNSEFCTNSFYSSFLKNCSDCFGCVGLKNKKNCILNNQLTKEQYEKAVKEIKKKLGWKV